MAKRTRTSRSAHRPGGQGPSRTKKASDAGDAALDDAVPATAGDELVTDAAYDEVEVDEVAAAAVATTAAPAAAAEAKSSRRRDRRRAKKQRPDALAAIATAETVWVRDDLRRIGIVSVILIVALAVCWVLFGYLDILNLY